MCVIVLVIKLYILVFFFLLQIYRKKIHVFESSLNE